MLTTGILFLSLWAVSSAQGKSFARMISFSVLWLVCIVDFCLIYICWTLKGHSFTTAAPNDFFQQNNGFPSNFLAREKLKYWITDPFVNDIHFRRLSTLLTIFESCVFTFYYTYIAIIVTKGLLKISIGVKTKRPIESNLLRSPCPRILPAGPRAANSFGWDGKAT